MSTAALRNKKVNKVERLPDSAQVNPASSPLASGSASSSSPRPIISACGCGRPRPSAPTRLKPRLGAWKGRVCVCVSGGQCGDAAFESLSPQKNFAASDSGAVGAGRWWEEINGDAQGSRKDERDGPPTDFFPCCSPPAPPSPPIDYLFWSPLFFSSHFRLRVPEPAHQARLLNLSSNSSSGSKL